jgi:TolB protein
VSRRLLSVAGLALCAALALAGCGGGGKPRPDLIFVSTKSGVYDIYAMNADGKRQTRLTRGKRGNASSGIGVYYAMDPDWSHDGKQIAFWSARDVGPRVFVMDADGRNAHPITTAPVAAVNPSWSPDGKRIVFSGGNPSQLEIMNADGTNIHRVTNAPTAVVSETSPAWSPNGRWIVYVRAEQGRPIKELWLVHPDGSQNHQLTNLQASLDSPAWSPDSRQIAFSSNARGGGHFGIFRIGQGGIGIRVVSLTTIDEIDPSWSPDGKRIAYSRDGAIVTVNPDGTDEQVITSGKDNDSSPVWNPIQAPKKTSKGGY